MENQNMNQHLRSKLKIVYLIVSAIFLIILSGDSQEYIHIHIEFPNKFIVEYEKNVAKK